MSATLERMRRQAVLLGQPDDPRDGVLDDVLELARREAPGWKPRQARMLLDGDPQAAGTQWYHDSRPPFGTADHTLITLSTTSLMLWPAATYTPTVAADWFPGKRMKIRVDGKITTAVTPGNLTIELRYGTTDNGGTILATSGAMALIASQTNMTFFAEFFITCRATGPTTTSGTLFGRGEFSFNVAVITAANQGGGVFPASAPAAVGSLDLNSASGLNVQFKRSGSTVETVTVTDVEFSHRN